MIEYFAIIVLGFQHSKMVSYQFGLELNSMENIQSVAFPQNVKMFPSPSFSNWNRWKIKIAFIKYILHFSFSFYYIFLFNQEISSIYICLYVCIVWYIVEWNGMISLNNSFHYIYLLTFGLLNSNSLQFHNHLLTIGITIRKTWCFSKHKYIQWKRKSNH